MRVSGAGLALVVISLAGCGDERSMKLNVGDEDSLFAGREVSYAEGDEFAALSENGAVKLGLTRDRVYFEVSDAVREHVDDEIAEGMAESDSRIARSIESAVRRGVRGALSIDVDFALDDIRDVDYVDGDLVFDFEEGHEGDARTLRNVELDDEPLARAFSEDDARAFVDAFRRVKAGDPGVSPRDSAASGDR